MSGGRHSAGLSLSDVCSDSAGLSLSDVCSHSAGLSLSDVCRLPAQFPLPGGESPVWPSLGPVLFPGDLRHPLHPHHLPHLQPGAMEQLLEPSRAPNLHPGAMEQLLEPSRAPPSTSHPLPIPSVQPVTPEPPVAEGSPMTPPNLHSFNFQD